MESQPPNPEIRNNPENFHPCISLPECCLLMIFANSLDPDQVCLELWYSKRIF